MSNRSPYRSSESVSISGTVATSYQASTIDAGNSTSALLGAGATFTGSWVSTTDYSTFCVTILGTVSTDGTLYVDLSPDGGSTYASLPFTVSDTTFVEPKIIRNVEAH